MRGDVAPEAGVIGACTARGGGVEPLRGAAEGVMLVVRPRQVLGVLTAGHALPVPGREGHHPTTTPRTPPLRRHSAVCGRFRLRGRRAARSTGHCGITHRVTHGIIHGNPVIHCVVQHRSGGSAGAPHGVGQDGVDPRAAAAQSQRGPQLLDLPGLGAIHAVGADPGHEVIELVVGVGL